ncbi:hypothetical protein [Neomicrococcus lactis]|uniref:Metal-dependent amidase/aminoacylase/carboxypeptidase family protein n=1 Tax=Neomicrococcus lactis TaxID=732241 RepID=A0A7W8YAP3_9MICC|nr:hypothetical protein [Neomicrococcus lactis]MBB5597942.1 metal-dependent amidase/aminoacylase/carboxypeptidase family protein [Neomicrococcus lactis]
MSNEAHSTMVENSKYLHQHPELSMGESATADRPDEQFSAIGSETFRCGGTGAVAVMSRTCRWP